MFKVARKRMYKALSNSQYDRHAKRWEFRANWIERMNAAARQHGLSYSRFQYALRLDNVQLDRKILADLAVTEPFTFRALVTRCKDVLAEVDKGQKRRKQQRREAEAVREKQVSRHLESAVQLTEKQREYIRNLALGRA